MLKFMYLDLCTEHGKPSRSLVAGWVMHVNDGLELVCGLGLRFPLQYTPAECNYQNAFKLLFVILIRAIAFTFALGIECLHENK